MGDPELQLIIEACRSSFFAPSPPFKLPNNAVNWGRLLSWSRRHRLQGLCWNALRTHCEHIPDDVASSLRHDAEAVAGANLQNAAESARLLQNFRSAGVDLLFLKGLALAALAYPDPFLKMGWDIDLLVSIDQLGQASALLRSAGYEPTFPKAANEWQLIHWHKAHKESVWKTSTGDFFIDLHTRLADNPEMLRDVGMKSPRQGARLGNGIELPTLGSDELFAYLAVHGASSAWFRLKWAMDLAALLSTKTGIEIEHLYDRSQQLGAGRAAAQALLLIDRLGATELEPRIRNRLEVDPIGRWLADIAEREIRHAAEPTERPLGTLMIHLSQLALMPGIRFATGEMRRQFLDVAMRAAT